MFDSQGNFLFHSQDWRKRKNASKAGMPSNIKKTNVLTGGRVAGEMNNQAVLVKNRKFNKTGTIETSPIELTTKAQSMVATREKAKGLAAANERKKKYDTSQGGVGTAQTEMKKGLAANERKKHATSNSATASEQMKRGKAAVSKVVKDTRKPGNYDASGTVSVWPGARMNKVVDRKGKEKTNYPGGAGTAATEYRKALENAFLNNKMDPETRDMYLKLFAEDMEIEDYNRYEDEVRENERKRRNVEKKISDAEKEINKRKKKR